jgi:hypothetical protein
MFEFTTWRASFPDFFISLRHYTVIRKQLLLSNDRNRVRRAVLGLSQDGDSINLFENFRENSFKRELSNDTTANPPLFSLVNTFKIKNLNSAYCPPKMKKNNCIFQSQSCLHIEALWGKNRENPRDGKSHTWAPLNI